jgi:hypothetical protein
MLLKLLLHSLVGSSVRVHLCANLCLHLLNTLLLVQVRGVTDSVLLVRHRGPPNRRCCLVSSKLCGSFQTSKTVRESQRAGGAMAVALITLLLLLSLSLSLSLPGRNNKPRHSSPVHVLGARTAVGGQSAVLPFATSVHDCTFFLGDQVHPMRVQVVAWASCEPLLLAVSGGDSRLANPSH